MLTYTSQKIEEFFVGVSSPEKPVAYVLFVHGGPGGHAAYFEQALKEFPEYQQGQIGWICYDQRGCGRSQAGGLSLTHQQNVEDLKFIVDKVGEQFPLSALVGHSYGAALSYEYSENYRSQLPLVLLGRAKDPKRPPQRSLYMDLVALKEKQPTDYTEVVNSQAMKLGDIWALFKEIRSRLKETSHRLDHYWGNTSKRDWYESVKQQVAVKEDQEVFKQVVESLYGDRKDAWAPLEIENLNCPVLWINGCMDFLMGGEEGLVDYKGPITYFLQSGHYPHIEQPECFMRSLNAFIKKENH